MSDVTRILSEMHAGNAGAAEQLLPFIYDELRKLAAARLANEKNDNSVQATGLVHEAYLRLVDVDQVKHWNSRGHFFGAASEAMRRIMVERARAKASKKRGGEAKQIPLQDDLAMCHENGNRILEIDEALTALEEHDQQAAALVKMRFFGGMTHGEATEALGISRGTADGKWRLARAWLFKQLS